MKSEQESVQQIETVIYHIDKKTTEWAKLGEGNFEITPNFDDEGVIVGHSIVVVKYKIDKQPGQVYTAEDLALKSTLNSAKEYSRQEGTIICWNENQLNEDIALTFSDKKTCDRIWKFVCSFIGKNPFEVGRLPAPGQVEIPCSENLGKIVISVNEKQEAISYFVINKTKFLDDLLALGEKVLEQKNQEKIRLTYLIINGIVEYNDKRILKILCSSFAFPTILKVYQIYNQCSIDYIQLLNQRFTFLPFLIPFNQQTTEKIRISHHLTFFKDIVKHEITNTPLQTALLVAINQCNMDIFNYVISEPFLKDLILRLESKETISVTIRFIFELMTFTKQFNDDVKSKLVWNFKANKILDSFTSILTSKDIFDNLPNPIQIQLLSILFKCCLFNQTHLVDHLKLHIDSLDALAYRFHHSNQEIIEVIECLIHAVLQNGNNKRPPVQLLTTQFFIKLAGFIQESCEKGQRYIEQTERMVELMVLAVESNFEEKTTKLVELLAKYNIFYILFNHHQPLPFNKVKRILRVKLATIAVTQDLKSISVHHSLLESKFLKTVILWLNQCHKKNNILESAILNLLNQIFIKQKFIILEQVQNIQSQLPQIKIISKIVNKYNEMKEQLNADREKHNRILENEQEERYLNQESDTPMTMRKVSLSDHQIEEMESLKLMTAELAKKDSEEDLIVRVPKKEKAMKFELSFGSFGGGGEEGES